MSNNKEDLIAIIGGSGLYQMEGLRKIKEISVSTPFGKPSDRLIIGELEGRRVVFLPRHGRGHRLSPSKINYRANIYALKKIGVTRIISLSACGSLRQDYKPLDFVVVDQFVDRTVQRQNTFFDTGIVVHVAMAQPVCGQLRNVLYEAAKANSVRVHPSGTYLNMEGPAFSTFAESQLYRSWGMDIIGMTNFTEARLSREAEICYATLAAVTDYDCWHPEHDSVTIDMVLENLNKNIENAGKVIRTAIRMLPLMRQCPCADALRYAIVTNPKFISAQTKRKLKLLLAKYVK